jgi:dihydroorotate dehydrogenase electron transfer subunit
MKQQIQTEVLYNDALGAGFYLLGLGCREKPDKATPGQFVMIRVSPGYDPLLKRPFSIHRLKQDGNRVTMELLYKAVGRGTRMLAQLSPGDQTEVIGPLGRGFKVPQNPGCIYIAAGGVGVAPMVFLADRWIANEYPPQNLKVFLGARNRQELICADQFRKYGLKVHLTTDDGSAGDQCLITDPLAVAVENSPPDQILACGPNPMLACVVGIAEAHGIACQISMEAHMACGVGACLGCAVPTSDQSPSYLHVCLNGPVFPADRVTLA